MRDFKITRNKGEWYYTVVTDSYGNEYDNYFETASEANDWIYYVWDQEEWFNITGIAALPNSDLGSGAHYNESWSYDAIQADWDNRTIRTVWSQTGPDPSSGDEFHPNSPIQNQPEANHEPAKNKS